MNDILNFKSITTYTFKLPLKFNFKTAKGRQKNEEHQCHSHRVTNKVMFVMGECRSFFTEKSLFIQYRDDMLAKLWMTYILILRLMRTKPSL